MSESVSAHRVCLFGGSFDPPHVAHTLAAVWALQTLPIDELWWMPVYEHAFGKRLLAWDARVAMITTAIRDLPAMRICTIEREMHAVSRTIDTVRTLQKRYPSTEFSLLIGSDLVDEIPLWKEGTTLQNMLPIYVLGREGYGEQSIALPDVSSTELRAALRDERQDFCAPRLNKHVAQLIREHGWYRS